MINLCRVWLLVLMAVFVSGCSTIHTAIGSDKPTSELRAAVEAPVNVAAAESPFCKKPEEIVVAVEPEVITYPFNARLNFLLDRTEFTPESQETSRTIYRDIAARSPKEVVLVGHTDTSGASLYNDGLSMRRAERVKQDLINAGVSAGVINASGEGQHRLLISTPDNTVEVRNRRVEIFAR